MRRGSGSSMKLLVVCSILGSTFLGSAALGFSEFSGRGQGLAGSYSSLATGFDAVFWNPANLSISPRFSFNIATAGVEYSSNVSLGQYLGLYSRTYFNDRDKEIFAEGEGLSITSSVQSISFSFKNFAFVTYPYVRSEINIPKDVADLLLWGNEIDREYSLDGVSGKTEVGFALALSAATPLAGSKGFAFGGTVKYFRGLYYTEVTESHGYLGTVFDDTDLETEIYGKGGLSRRCADGGYGIGLDVGVIYASESYRIGGSVIDAFSERTWDEGATLTETTFELDSTGLDRFDSETSLKWENKERRGSFMTRPEPTFRLGGGLKGDRVALTLQIGYPQLFSTGIERAYGPVTLRVGTAFAESRWSFGWGVGFGPGPLNLDIGMTMSSLAHVSGALSLSVAID